MSGKQEDIRLTTFEQAFAPLLAELDVPIVAINADAPPTDEATIRLREPRFRVVTLAGTGHFVMMEKPRAFNALVARIVAAWAAPAAVAAPPLSEAAPTR